MTIKTEFVMWFSFEFFMCFCFDSSLVTIPVLSLEYIPIVLLCSLFSPLLVCLVIPCCVFVELQILIVYFVLICSKPCSSFSVFRQPPLFLCMMMLDYDDHVSDHVCLWSCLSFYHHVYLSIMRFSVCYRL